VEDYAGDVRTRAASELSNTRKCAGLKHTHTQKKKKTETEEIYWGFIPNLPTITKSNEPTHLGGKREKKKKKKKKKKKRGLSLSHIAPAAALGEPHV
jgi:hypothetical protein